KHRSPGIAPRRRRSWLPRRPIRWIRRRLDQPPRKPGAEPTQRPLLAVLGLRYRSTQPTPAAQLPYSPADSCPCPPTRLNKAGHVVVHAIEGRAEANYRPGRLRAPGHTRIRVILLSAFLQTALP